MYLCLLTGCYIHWHLKNKQALSQFSMDNLYITIQRKKRKGRGREKGGKEEEEEKKDGRWRGKRREEKMRGKERGERV